MPSFHLDSAIHPHPAPRPLLAGAAALLLLGACAQGGLQSSVRPAVAPVDETIQAPVGLTVGGAPQQTFKGFGFSFTHDDPYLALRPDEREMADRLLFTELDTKIVRLWHRPGDPARTVNTYKNGGVVDGALKSGVEELLLAPEGYTQGDPEGYAETLTNDIVALQQAGVPITVTGTQNEPGSDYRADIPPEEQGRLYRAMRQKLDQKGLQDVALLAPEYASNDDGPKRFYDAIQGDPEAFAAIDGIAHHSYNMAADQDLGQRALGGGKDYWQTEAGGRDKNGSAEFDYDFGANASARFLNDLNNGVTHWVWFIGLGEGDQDVLQKLVRVQHGGVLDQGTFYKNYSYHHLQQISRQFPPGTVLRHVTSDLQGYPDLVWTHGVKPPLNAAAGLRPDGRFIIALVNSSHEWGREGPFGFHAAATYPVTVDVPELGWYGDLSFSVCRTGRSVTLDCSGKIQMDRGRLSLDLPSAELVTLISDGRVAR
jgi:hypothetical protein